MKSIFFVFILFQVQLIHAQHSIIDEKFGTNGYASTIRLTNRNFIKILQTEDSGYLAVGEYQSSSQSALSVTKFKNNGQLDMRFGSSGVYNNTILPSAFIQVNTACLTHDKGILICGTVFQYSIYTKSIFILKLKTNGDLDSSFGNNGVKIELSGYTNSFSFIREDRHHKIIMGQARTVGGASSNCYIIKLKSNGDIDSNFQNNGEMVLSNSLSSNVKNFDITQDNHYLVSYYLNGARNPSFANLDSNGKFNNKFGSYGIMSINVSPLNSSSSCGMWPLEDNGFYLYAMISVKSSLASIVIVKKYNKNGQLDTTFGRNGITSNYLTSEINYGIDYFKLDNKKRIVLGMRFYDSCVSIDPFGNDYYCDYTSAIYRFNSKGWPDSTFNSTGIFRKFKDCEFNDEASDIFIQDDCKIVVIGKIIEKGNSLRGFMCRLNEYYPSANLKVENNLIENLKIYPMPFTDKITINGVSGLKGFKVFSMFGQLIYQKKTTDTLISNLDFLSNGNYILEIEAENNTIYRYKILKSE